MSKSVKQMTLAAVFAAMIFVVTYFIKIPVPGVPGGAYINGGDAVIYAAAIVLGSPWAAAAAGIGSSLADLLGGAVIYLPATLAIKAAMGLIVGVAARKKGGYLLWLGLMSAASLLMAACYGLYELVVFGVAVAAANVPFNLIQAVGGVALGMGLAAVVNRVVPASWKDTLQ